MIKGMLGKKVGMTQVFTPEGRVVPVTVIQAGPCAVTQVKTVERDGYQAAQVGYGSVKRLNKPMRGHLGRAGLFRHLREFAVDGTEDLEVGQQIKVDLFESGEKVDVVGTSKGLGFQGGMKRHGFHGGPRTHGQSDRARAPGSIGAGTYPGRVFKGKKMAGHTGAVRVTVKNLEVVDVDAERDLLFLKGGVPGAPNDLIVIKKVK
ncbi:MAG: 50S ribosomal protein L3 [Dehalococcoidia bacterium]|nr:50S ribosomal protein L3 [Dehalococcoidia bacterium]